MNGMIGIQSRTTKCVECEGISLRGVFKLNNGLQQQVGNFRLITCNKCLDKQKKDTIQEKKCVGCNIFRPVYHYDKNKQTFDGYTYYCKACIKENRE